ncbi:MAG: fatty acid desaturase, partial [Planctomycetales bacterium]
MATVQQKKQKQKQPTPSKSLKSREFKRALQQLRGTDNCTNFLYIARAYVILATAIGGAIWFYHAQAAAGWSFWWNVPVTFLAILVVGASQHQLAGATHEATHHTLFKNRWLNELASDFLCMFPMFSSTYIFRLHHLAHHQFINDPERDPDFSQLIASGHWLKFPISKATFLSTLLRYLWLP